MENLVHQYGRYFDIPRAECRRRAMELLKFVQLSGRAPTASSTPLSGGMMRRLSIAIADQPARLAAARRADYRARSAKPCVFVGPSVPIEERRRHADHHDALHGRETEQLLHDRLVVMDSGRIVAMGSPRSR